MCVCSVCSVCCEIGENGIKIHQTLMMMHDAHHVVISTCARRASNWHMLPRISQPPSLRYSCQLCVLFIVVIFANDEGLWLFLLTRMVNARAKAHLSREFFNPRDVRVSSRNGRREKIDKNYFAVFSRLICHNPYCSRFTYVTQVCVCEQQWTNEMLSANDRVNWCAFAFGSM